MDVTRGRRRWRRGGTIFGGLVALGVAAVLAIPVFANLTGSGFDAGDGNLVVNDETSDWANAPNFTKSLDKLSGTGDNAFGQGTSEDDPVPSLKNDGIPPNKSDITRFYQSHETVPVSGADKTFLYLGWERISDPTGTTNFDFELNQSSTMSSNGETPVRTAGDVLINYDLSNGGTNPVLGFHRWVTSGGSASAVCEASSKFPCWDKVHAIAGVNFEAAINDGDVTDPIAPDNPRTLGARTFGEAGINLTDSGILPATTSGNCTGFASAYLKSRSSDSFNSAIKDFASPLTADINNCGSLAVQNYIDIDEDGTQDTGERPTTIAADVSGWSFTITGPNSFSCTGTTNSSGVLTSCLKADSTAANLSGLQQGTYTITENANASKTIGSNSSPFFNTDPGPTPKAPPVSDTATVAAAGSVTKDFGNSCYAKANFEVDSVPSTQSGLFVRYKVNGGTSHDVNLTKDGTTANYKGSVGSLRKGDEISWSYGINHGAANEQTQAVLVNFTLAGYPTCVGSGTVNFGSTTINGSKFKDINGNGTKDAGEGGLQGFTFQLKKGTDVIDTQKSGSTGAYSFSSVEPGSYTIHEVGPPTGWSQTQPAGGADVSVSASLGQASVTADPFGNTPLSTIGVTFTPKAKLLNADGTPSATDATKATSITCTDQDGNSVGSATNSNTKTTNDVQIKQSGVTCVVNYTDP
jgi:hypothetical protein